MEEIKTFVDQFITSYTKEAIEEDTVGYFNDIFMMIEYFKKFDKNEDLKNSYSEFIKHVLKHENLLKEYSTFNFSGILNLDDLFSDKINSLQPIYTTYSFLEIEEMIDQMFDEMKVEKEFKKQIKSEIEYLLEEYIYHVDHLEENMMYNFYSYEELIIDNDADKVEKIELFQTEKRKYIQRCNDRLK